ncbi:MAG: single-stranded DNA-binding protein [Chloroflexota bacterium]|nr:single-stranded DNA-binding protein [Chloroflexota bacterium]
MAKTLNKVQLIGRLGSDPEVRYTAAGMAVATFSLATNRQWKGEDGTLQEDAEWHTIVAWDKLAQVCNDYLGKGRLVYVEGRLQTRSWESNGQKRYKTEIVASEMLILDSKSPVALGTEESVEQSDRQSGRQSNEPQPVTRGSIREVPARYEVLAEDPDDLPF